MDILIYLILVLGSYSIGYGLIRVGFPLTQKKKLIEKIALGYVGGIVLFGLPFLILETFGLTDLYYPIACILIYFMLILVLLLKRTILNETDALTKEDMSQMSKNTSTDAGKYSSAINYSNLIKEEKGEKESIQPKAKQSSVSKSINFDQGLMVKSRNKGEEQKAPSNLNKTNVTNQKESIMSKLRESAQEIKDYSKKGEKQNNKKKEDDDLEEDDELMELIKDE